MNSARTKSIPALALTLAVTAAIGTATSTGATSPREVVTCHGKTATYVGTEGADRVGNADDLGTNPVIVLAGGNDKVSITTYATPFRSLTVCGGDGSDKLSISAFDGPLIGRRPEIVLDGGLGNDFVGNKHTNFTDLPAMTLIGGVGSDELSGAVRNDTVSGGRGQDVIRGLGGDDVLAGNAGSDQIRGERDDDRMLGGQGNDVLIGDVAEFAPGDDFANGGSGTDRCDAEKEKSCES